MTSKSPEHDRSMTGQDQDDVARLLKAIKAGKENARQRLLDLVYQELRRIAHWEVNRAAKGPTLETTSLVHEAYLRLIGTDGSLPFESRGHFFSAAAEAMRRIVVERARKRRGIKHGGGIRPVSLPENVAGPVEASLEVLAVDEALEALERHDARKALVVKHRYFLGLSVSETSGLLGVSERTVDNDWQVAKAWLKRELSKGDPGPAVP